MEVLSTENEFRKTKQLLHITMLEFDKVLSNLVSFVDNRDMKDKRVGVFFHTLKYYYCIEDLIKLSENNGSVQSMMTLNRMIVDNYAILYLLTSHSSDNEQLLRYYLFLFDAIKTRTQSLSDFFENCNAATPPHIYNNVMSALNQDSKDMIQIIDLLKKDGIYDLVSPFIVEKFNWKYKNAKQKKKNSKNQYSWVELYQIARIPKQLSKMIQNHHSQYVHGLGLSMMTKPNDDCISLIKSLFDTTNILIWNSLKILLNTFDGVIDEKILNTNTVKMMNVFWNENDNEDENN